MKAATAARTAALPRVLVVRRPLRRPAADSRRLLRAMRGLLVRRVLMLGAILVTLCLAKVWLRLQVVRLGYELSTARQVQLRLEHEGHELEVELAMLRDHGRLNDLARRRLQMTDAGRGQVVELR